MRIERTNTILYCDRWAETVAFYRDVFGFAVKHQTDWFVELEVGEKTYISVANASRATIKSGGGDGVTLSWQVADIDMARRLLSQHGVKMTGTREKWGARLFYLHDPEGNRVELWQPLD